MSPSRSAIEAFHAMDFKQLRAFLTVAETGNPLDYIRADHQPKIAWPSTMEIAAASTRRTQVSVATSDTRGSSPVTCAPVALAVVNDHIRATLDETLTHRVVLLDGAMVGGEGGRPLR